MYPFDPGFKNPAAEPAPPASSMNNASPKNSYCSSSAPQEERGRFWYGFGTVACDIGGVPIFEHGGVRRGYGSFIRRIPSKKIGIAVKNCDEIANSLTPHLALARKVRELCTALGLAGQPISSWAFAYE